MRIRGSAASSVFPTPTISPSPSPSSSSSYFSSSSSPSSTHSTISHHSMSSSSSSSSLFPSRRRCQGLDLLVKAVYHVAGSVVGVPYIQKRVIRRRKRAVRFTNLVISSSDKEETELLENDLVGEVLDGNSQEKMKKKQMRSKVSVLPALKPVIRRRRRSKV